MTKKERDSYNTVTTKFTTDLYDALELYSTDEQILLPKDLIVRFAVEEYLKKNYMGMGNSHNKISVSILLNENFEPRKGSRDEKAYKEFLHEDDCPDNVRQFKVIP